MNPVVSIWLGSLHLYTTSYRLFMATGAAATIGVSLLLAYRRGMPKGRALACILMMAGAVPVGARLLDLATKPGDYGGDPWRLWSLDLTGLSMYGGLLLGLLVGVTGCRMLRVDLVGLADCVSPALGIGIALVRIGCFEAGCCFGVSTELPWGVTFPAGSDAYMHQLLSGGVLVFGREVSPAHPTQLYEALASLVGAWLALSLLRRCGGDGNAFLAFVAWYSGFRLLNHFFRVPGAGLVVPGLFYPAVYGGVALVSLTMLLVRNSGPARLESRL